MKYTLFQDIGKELIFYGIYNTSVDMWDGKDIICLARKRFFETGTAQKKRSTIKTENGLYSYSYNIADGSNIRYKKSRGTQIAERSVDVSGGYCIETFDRFRAPFKRTYYNDDHSWRETEYYSPLDRSVNMNIRPLYENGSTYITVRNSSGTKKLVPFNSSLDKETTDKLNEIAGEPDIFCVTSSGSFYFCTEEEYNKRKKALEKLVNGEETVSENEDDTKPSSENENGGFSLKNSADVFIDREAADEDEKLDEVTETAISEEQTEEQAETETEEFEEQTEEQTETKTEEFEEQTEEQTETETAEAEEIKEEAENIEEEKEMAEITEGMSAGASLDNDGKLLYAGGMVNGRQSGAGMTYNEDDHTFFIGKYKDGKFLGTGTQFSFDGEIIYRGGFKDGHRDGYGIEYDNDTVIYKGMWSGGKYSGCGMLFENNAPKYAGKFENGCMNGRINEMSDNAVVRKSIYADNVLKVMDADRIIVMEKGRIISDSDPESCAALLRKENHVMFDSMPSSVRISMTVQKELEDIPECGELSGTEYGLFCKAPEYAIEKMIEAGGETGIYTGKLKNGRPYGKGTILYPDYYYTGGFVDGKLYGEGTVYLNSGEEIKGVFSASPIPDGKTITLSDVLYYYSEQ